MSGCSHACIHIAKLTVVFDQNGKQHDKFKSRVAVFSCGAYLAVCPTSSLANLNNIDIPQETGILDQKISEVRSQLVCMCVSVEASQKTTLVWLKLDQHCCPDRVRKAA